MPLLDHFHPPLLGKRRWESLHGRWATSISDALNEHLPEHYFAETQVSLGTRFEVDVATFSETPIESPDKPNGSALAVMTRVWAPPMPASVVPAIFPDEFEVRVFSSAAGPVLVAAIELVSPGNKDREESRRAFVAKCSAYLQQGIGLVVVDVVTGRNANLHDELMAFLGHGGTAPFQSPTSLYTTAYRPAHRQDRNEIDIWREELGVGMPLPTMPLAIRGLGYAPIELESTYTEACKRGRIG